MCYCYSMSYGKLWWMVFVIVLVVSSVTGYSYYAATGGNGLTRVVFYYLIRNIPDKQYDWRDFTDQGTTNKISGFYSSGDKDSFRLWTLSGLKAFHTLSGTSIYMYEDVCSGVKYLQENPETPGSEVTIPKHVTQNILTWEELMKKENFVTVQRLVGQDNPNMVDKVWSFSGKYKIISQLDLEACN